MDHDPRRFSMDDVLKDQMIDGRDLHLQGAHTDKTQHQQQPHQPANPQQQQPQDPQHLPRSQQHPTGGVPSPPAATAAAAAQDAADFSRSMQHSQSMPPPMSCSSPWQLRLRRSISLDRPQQLPTPRQPQLQHTSLPPPPPPQQQQQQQQQALGQAQRQVQQVDQATDDVPVWTDDVQQPAQPAGPRRPSSTDTAGFQLGALIGAGSFGKVYKGSYNGRPVAVKLIEAHGDELALAMVQNELELVMGLNHPNIVQALHVALWQRPSAMAGPEEEEFVFGEVSSCSLSGQQLVYNSGSSSGVLQSSGGNALGQGRMGGPVAAAAAAAAAAASPAVAPLGGCMGAPDNNASSSGYSLQLQGNTQDGAEQPPRQQQEQEPPPLQQPPQQQQEQEPPPPLQQPPQQKQQPPVGLASSDCVLLGEPGAVSSRSSNSSECQAWLVLEYCDGGTMEAAVMARRYMGSTRTPNMPLLLKHLLQVAQGLAYLHQHHVLHNDLKPANVLLSSNILSAAAATATSSASSGNSSALPTSSNSNGQGSAGWPQTTSRSLLRRRSRVAPELDQMVCKISDFGVSRTMAPELTHHATMTIGTLSHMAPEVLQHGRLSTAADVYSFGIMMWELAHASSAFSEFHYEGQLLESVLTGRRPTWSMPVTPGYQELAESCWDTQPAARPTLAKVVQWLEVMQQLEEQQLLLRARQRRVSLSGMHASRGASGSLVGSASVVAAAGAGVDAVAAGLGSTRGVHASREGLGSSSSTSMFGSTRGSRGGATAPAAPTAAPAAAAAAAPESGHAPAADSTSHLHTDKASNSYSGWW